MDEEDPIEIPITPELDLHTFRPSEIAELLPEYFRECRERGILRVRVIHGKGTGALRKALRDYFKNHPVVKEVETAPLEQGGEGVTIVKL